MKVSHVIISMIISIDGTSDKVEWLKTLGETKTILTDC